MSVSRSESRAKSVLLLAGVLLASIYCMFRLAPANSERDKALQGLTQRYGKPVAIADSVVLRTGPGDAVFHRDELVLSDIQQFSEDRDAIWIFCIDSSVRVTFHRVLSDHFGDVSGQAFTFSPAVEIYTIAWEKSEGVEVQVTQKYRINNIAFK